MIIYAIAKAGIFSSCQDGAHSTVDTRRWPKLVCCWASVADGRPTVNQHWANASCLPCRCCYIDVMTCVISPYLARAIALTLSYKAITSRQKQGENCNCICSLLWHILFSKGRFSESRYLNIIFESL